MSGSDDLQRQLGAVAAFLDDAPLRRSVATLEKALAGRRLTEISAISASNRVTLELLHSAFAARNTFGKINDVIHAAAITLSLPYLMQPGEELLRLSLAAGNTPVRLFDVETTVRIAEFKLARWDGNDGGRQKTTVKDLARLAADKSGRLTELYVLGERPITWLRTTKSSVRTKIKGYPTELAAFEGVFDNLDVPISTFVTNEAARVHLINLELRLPTLFPSGAG